MNKIKQKDLKDLEIRKEGDIITIEQTEGRGGLVAIKENKVKELIEKLKDLK